MKFEARTVNNLPPNDSSKGKPDNKTALTESSTQANSSHINKIEILNGAPEVMRRPLVIIGDHAYAATWPFVKVTTNREKNEKGEVIQLDQEKTFEQQLLTIIRDDGALFHLGDDAWEQLGFTVELSEIPKSEKLWSEKGIQRYKNGERVNAKVLFEQLCDVIDTFIDFDKSTADQRTMSEFIAGYILATWFLDAFNVIGFLWPNGERGSGKTQLLSLITTLGFLGHLLLAGGTYASLRDLADYGATLGFDDAENLSSKKLDPDKRAILLAGNRKGSTVTLKESTGNGKWKTRYVDTYCPRAFSAISLPDPVLASRTIIVPLVRTSDKTKANSDPLEYKKWPHDFRGLIDDLWSLALANLVALSGYEEKVNQQSSLRGRDLEPWRATLSVALWLEEIGVSGLWERINTLSHKYQNEREDFESDDFTGLLIRAVAQCIQREVVKCGDVSEGQKGGTKHFILTNTIATHAEHLAEDLQIEIDGNEITSKKIGKKLSQMRFNKHREGGTGKAGWRISLDEIRQMAKALGIAIDAGVPDETSQTSHDPTTSPE